MSKPPMGLHSIMYGGRVGNELPTTNMATLCNHIPWARLFAQPMSSAGQLLQALSLCWVVSALSGW